MAQSAQRMAAVVMSAIASVIIFFSSSWFHRGGPVMVPVLFCSVFGVAVILAKVQYFVFIRCDHETFLRNIFDLLERQRIKEALEICERTSAPIGRVAKAGIMKYDRSKDEIREAMDEAFRYEIPLLEDHLDLLKTVVQITPLLGFLATMVGFIQMFNVIQSLEAANMTARVSDVAPAFWGVLITTTTAFLVSVPLLVGYNYASYRAQRISQETEKASSALWQFLLERRISG